MQGLTSAIKAISNHSTKHLIKLGKRMLTWWKLVNHKKQMTHKVCRTGNNHPWSA